MKKLKLVKLIGICVIIFCLVLAIGTINDIYETKKYADICFYENNFYECLNCRNVFKIIIWDKCFVSKISYEHSHSVDNDTRYYKVKIK